VTYHAHMIPHARRPPHMTHLPHFSRCERLLAVPHASVVGTPYACCGTRSPDAGDVAPYNRAVSSYVHGVLNEVVFARLRERPVALPCQARACPPAAAAETERTQTGPRATT
jgi:hypothetical protein